MSSPQDNTGFCSDLVRDRNFAAYALSLFVRGETRRGLLALAAFNAEVSHVRDHVSQPLPGEIRLQWWRDVLADGDNHHTGEAAANPVLAELQWAIARYDLPRESLIRLIDAHVFDVYDDPMPDLAALEAHGRDTASALYMLRAKISGAETAHIDAAADHAGLAEGLTETMMALPKHAARHQLYIPADVMALYGVTAQNVFAMTVTPALLEATAHLRREARRQLDQAMDLIAALPSDIRLAFLPLALVEKTLTALETSPPFDLPRWSRLQILWTLWRAARSKNFRS